MIAGGLRPCKDNGVTPESQSNLRLEIGHVLFIDLVGYSKLLIEEQKERLRQLTEVVLATAQVREAPDEQLIRLPTGDGMALVFRNSSEEPARCALQIAGALKKYPEIRVRMGIHSGPVSDVADVSGRTNIAGAGINVAQRVMDCGDAGHILLSRHVAEDLEQYSHWQPHLHDLGECEVKHGVRLGVVNLYRDELGNPDLPRKFKALKKRRSRMRWLGIGAAFLLLAAILAAFLVVSRKPAQVALNSAEKSIAVLPFENRSEDRANAYFADGIQDEILTRLSKIADLKVISRTSTQSYHSKPRNLTEIARQLGVANILEGSVQKAADQVRVNVQLINAQTDSHLWAETYDRKLTDIFGVESEIAKGIAESLQARLTGRERRALAVKPTNKPEAYDAYLRGLAFDARTRPQPDNTGPFLPLMLQAADSYEQAVQLDPNFALAWGRLSRVDANLYVQRLYPASGAGRDGAAKLALEKAQTLEPSSPETLLALGYYQYLVLRDSGLAKTTFGRVSKILPGSSEVPRALGLVNRREGHWDESIAYFEQALALDPRNVELVSDAAKTYAMVRRFPDALKLYDRLLDITPDDLQAVSYKVWIYQAQGNLQEAARLLSGVPDQPPDRSLFILKFQQLRLLRDYGKALRLSQARLAHAHDDPYSKAFWGLFVAAGQRLAGDTAGGKVTAESCLSTSRAVLQRSIRRCPVFKISVARLLFDGAERFGP